MPNELVRVDFHGDAIEVMARDDGTILVGLRQLCRILEVDYDFQVRRLRGRSWAYLTTEKVPTARGAQPTTMIDTRTLHGWLFSLDENKIRESLRPKLVRYQAECVDALQRHFGNRPIAEPNRPWATRFRESFAPHSQAVLSGFPPGSFTVITEGVMTMLMLEDELIRHMMEVRPGDRPCISIGLTWSHYRRQSLGRSPGGIGEAPIWLPDRAMEVPVKVYSGSEMHQFKTWLHFVYLPEKLRQYLDGKPEFKSHGSLPRASVADNACRTITGRPADLPAHLRRMLTASGNFSPASVPRPKPPELGV